MTAPTLVLVGGGWHVPASYSKLSNALKEAGYDVHVPRHPSTDEARPPINDLATDTEALRKYVGDLVEEGRTVVVAMHSYGGQVGTNALWDMDLKTRARQNLSGGISRLIYMCAFALPEGGSMIQKVEEMGDGYLMPIAFDFADDGSVVPRDPQTILIGPSDDEEVDPYLATLVRWNGKCMHDSITHCAWRHIPVTYLSTTQDFTIPVHYQESMVDVIRGQGVEVQAIQIESGHCPNLTKTNEVVDAINNAIGWTPTK
ncbi:hypothetical protein LHYA1_G001154 [Lachnellula hyalina]|uniref:AB hydrolase-1 domain-containing protein n=1 Tax=Lachnellula hyalina TaxID=1316788 RepID=A0A8H8RAM9_9HELO|nr:uncharacterized protein LHYA1_G001154 [Lachnellula hyalina]TVY30662.1 hypothetical protein LHYA1_G001154 [Lachnellula hyalina]